MDSIAVEELARRVGRLERECRRWRQACLAGLVGALTLIVGGAARRPTDELKVERLVIQDKGNDRRGMTLGTQDGIPSLTFFGDGQEKISLAISDDGVPMLSFFDAGKPRLALGLNRAGAPVLNLNDENQRRRVSLGIFAKVGPMISVLDEKNKVIFKAP